MSATHPVRTRQSRGGDQVVEVIVDHGYRPQSIVARANMPLRLVFRRRDDDACMDRIVFSSPHLDRRLARDAATTIVLPAQAPGEIRFTCGMGRYHGQIELRSGPSSSLESAIAIVTEELRHGWRLIRGTGVPDDDGQAAADAPDRFTPNEATQEESQRASPGARQDGRETAP